MGMNFDEPDAPDINDHFENDTFFKTIDEVKELSIESNMRKVNA